MEKRLRMGLVGAGRIGKLHAEILARHVPNAEVVRVTDYVRESAESCAAAYGIPHVDATFQDMVQDETLDAVLIASSTDTHAPFIMDAARAGKHIFCEKPIGSDLAQIDEALGVVDKAGVQLQIGFNRRFDSNFSRMKQAIEAGDIGTPHTIHIVSRDPGPPPISYIKVSGGLFFDMMIHDFDMVRFLIGDVKEVYAVAGVKVDPAIGEAGDVDSAIVTLVFDNGVFGTIENSREAVYGYDQRVEVFGSGGSIQNANVHPDVVTVSTAENVRRASLPLNFFIERYTQAYITELQTFVDCIANDKPVPVTGEDGKKPVAIAMAAKKSYEEHRPVQLAEITGA